MFICRQKLNFIPHAVMEILQRYANLFWVLWACLVTITQNDTYRLGEDFNVSLHTKNKLHNSLFLQYYILKNPAIWLASSISASKLTWDPKLCQICWWNINKNIIDHFQEKLTWQNFSKNPKNPILGPIAQIWTKNEFCWKRDSVSFSIIELPTIVPKIRKS